MWVSNNCLIISERLDRRTEGEEGNRRIAIEDILKVMSPDRRRRGGKRQGSGSGGKGTLRRFGSLFVVMSTTLDSTLKCVRN